jgi:hypothetical protein
MSVRQETLRLGNMQKQQAASSRRCVWLTLNSAAAGKQGRLDASRPMPTSPNPPRSRPPICSIRKASSALRREDHAHLYVVDKDGILRYAGGIDSVASTDPGDIAAAIQYVPQVLAELAAGKTVSTTRSEPYGCSVKYGG